MAEKEDVNTVKNYIIQNNKNNKIDRYINLHDNNNINEYNESKINENNEKKDSDLVSILKITLNKLIDSSLTNIQNEITYSINSKLDKMDERINNLQNKIQKVIHNKKNQTVMIPQLKNNNLTTSLHKDSQTSELWQKSLKLLSINKFSEAYRLILQTEDDIYLLRLVMLTGPVLKFLDRDIAKKILVRVNMINRGHQIKNVLIKLIEDSLKTNGENDCIFSSLTFQEQNDILDSLYNIFKKNKKGEINEKAEFLYKKIIQNAKESQSKISKDN